MLPAKQAIILNIGPRASFRRIGGKGLSSELQNETVAVTGIEVELNRDAPATDNGLVRAFISGNDEAFNQLVTRYKDPLVNYLNMMVGDYEIAADLSQETFLRVYRNIRRYSNLYQFSTWIYRIATNLAIDEMRYRKRRGRVFYKNVSGPGCPTLSTVEWVSLPEQKSMKIKANIPTS